MDFSSPFSESWNSDPQQNKFIENYFKHNDVSKRDKKYKLITNADCQVDRFESGHHDEVRNFHETTKRKRKKSKINESDKSKRMKGLQTQPEMRTFTNSSEISISPSITKAKTTQKKELNKKKLKMKKAKHCFETKNINNDPKEDSQKSTEADFNIVNNTSKKKGLNKKLKMQKTKDQLETDIMYSDTKNATSDCNSLKSKKSNLNTIKNTSEKKRLNKKKLKIKRPKYENDTLHSEAKYVNNLQKDSPKSINPDLNTFYVNSQKSKFTFRHDRKNCQNSSQAPSTKQDKNFQSSFNSKNRYFKQNAVWNKFKEMKPSFLRDVKHHQKSFEPSNHEADEDSTSKIKSNFQRAKINISVDLRTKAQQCIQAAKFRCLNEKLYTSSGHDAYEYFKENPGEFDDYHQNYQIQAMKWPLNPVDEIIKDIKQKNSNLVIADMGCGDAKIAQTFPKRKVHSFDLVPLNEHVTACDIAKVPLPNESIDIIVFCLSLMGTNLKDYLFEAHRLLKSGSILKIAEVISRIENLMEFIKAVEQFGFTLERKDVSNQMFVFLDFVKKKKKLKKAQCPEIALKPCLYKKR